MQKLVPCKRKDFIRRLYKLGFEGPFAGKRHQFMVYKHHRLAIPSNREYSVPQLKMMFNEIEAIIGYKITVEKWSKLK